MGRTLALRATDYFEVRSPTDSCRNGLNVGRGWPLSVYSSNRTNLPSFKANATFAAIAGEWTLDEPAKQFDGHASEITAWKAQLQESVTVVFAVRHINRIARVAVVVAGGVPDGRHGDRLRESGLSLSPCNLFRSLSV